MISIRAKDVLAKRGKRKVSQPSSEDLAFILKDSRSIIEELNSLNINTTPPKTRGECPNFRPCPFVSCKHNLYLEVKKSGSITLNYPEIEPEQMKHSCALDVAEANPDGLSFSEIGEKLNLTRERVRQIQEEAFKNVKKGD